MKSARGLWLDSAGSGGTVMNTWSASKASTNETGGPRPTSVGAAAGYGSRVRFGLAVAALLPRVMVEPGWVCCVVVMA